MDKWLILAIFSAAIAVIILYATGHEYQEYYEEGFSTIDLNTAKAQRQQMQWEGERRYNNFARVQSPYANLSADAVDAALRQEFPVSSKQDPSLLSLLPTSLMGAADDGTNKKGDRLEQTGVITEKIAFCETLSVTNCDALSDIRYAECGICHKDGVSSTGKKYKGGMYISSDDQIRANQLAKVNGGFAEYKPTIGTCAPGNFTVMPENCEAKANSIMCEMTSAPTSNNQCGQCFNSSGPLLYVGQKPISFPVILNVSHPGIHNSNGAGLRLIRPDGNSETLQSSKKRVLDPKQITLEATEGDRFQIVIYGAPAVWCAWFSSVDGTRTVSLDIGVTGVSPTNGLLIGGDKRSKNINKALEKEAEWSEFKKRVPDTVFWFMRRNEVIPPAIVKAVYGTTDAPTTVTATVQTAAGTNQELVVRNLIGGDPSADRRNYSLVLSQDTGGVIKAVEGGTIKASRIYNMVTLDVTLPATLRGPLYDTEQSLCSTGPMVLTEGGAGIMGSHSCYNSKGEFNPTVYCLTQLFTSAGGTSSGTFYPGTAEAAAKLVVKGTDGKPSLDATVDSLNNMANIAIYGMDNQGAPADFATRKAAALGFLNISMVNPCDGPTASVGPHSSECLDYLWKTSGNPSQDSTSVDPTTLPYAYCSSSGLSAPVINGSVNLDNVQNANDQGGITGVRAFFNGLFARSQDSSDFDAQAAAMKACYGPNIDTSLKSPPVCPSQKTCDWIAVANAATWTQIDGGLVQASISDNDTIIGVNYKNETYGRYVTQPWANLYGSLSQVDTNGKINVGVSNIGQYSGQYGGPIYKATNGSNWAQMPGAAVCISIGADNTIWCVNKVGNIFQWNGTNDWTLIPGGASWVTVGDAQNVYVVGYSDGGKLWKYGSSGFKEIPIPVAAKQVSVTAGSSKIVIFGQNGNIYGSDNGGVSWRHIDGNFNGSVSISNNYLLAVNSSNSSIYTRKISC